MRRSSLVYSVTRRFARFVFSLLYRIEIEWEEEILFGGPAVVLPKHQYWTDIPLVSLSFSYPLYFVAKKELFRLPGVRSYLSLLGGIPLDRDQSVKTYSSIKYLLLCLKEAGKVVLFPEGTYVRGFVGSGKNRLIRLMLGIQPRLEDPISFIPMGIRYGQRVGLRRDVKIRIGRPLFAGEKSDAISLTNRIMEEISRLSGLPPLRSA